MKRKGESRSGRKGAAHPSKPFGDLLSGEANAEAKGDGAIEAWKEEEALLNIKMRQILHEREG